jgi:hypothetical protein
LACNLCIRLESEFETAERRHAELLGQLSAQEECGNEFGIAGLRIAESDARIDAKLAQELLAAHRRHHARQN